MIDHAKEAAHYTALDTAVKQTCRRVVIEAFALDEDVDLTRATFVIGEGGCYTRLVMLDGDVVGLWRIAPDEAAA